MRAEAFRRLRSALERGERAVLATILREGAVAEHWCMSEKELVTPERETDGAAEGRAEIAEAITAVSQEGRSRLERTSRRSPNPRDALLPLAAPHRTGRRTHRPAPRGARLDDGIQGHSLRRPPFLRQSCAFPDRRTGDMRVLGEMFRAHRARSLLLRRHRHSWASIRHRMLQEDGLA